MADLCSLMSDRKLSERSKVKRRDGRMHINSLPSFCAAFFPQYVSGPPNREPGTAKFVTYDFPVNVILVDVKIIVDISRQMGYA